MKKISRNIAIALIFPTLLTFWAFKPAPSPQESVNWVSIEEAAALAEKDGKKILVDVYTDWCGWCKRMDKATYQNPEVVAYLNKNFHAVKFDAEQREDVVLRGRTFKYVPQGRRGYHELAAGILQGKMSYPSTVFLNENLEILTDIKGFRKAKEMMAFLTYFKEEAYKRKVNLQQYLDEYTTSE